MDERRPSREEFFGTPRPDRKPFSLKNSGPWWLSLALAISFALQLADAIWLHHRWMSVFAGVFLCFAIANSVFAWRKRRR